MRAKPWNMKYTDLCIYIDKTVYYRDEDGNPTGLRKLTPEEIDNVYTYLYDLIYALAVKKRLLTNKNDYNAFCLEAAGDIFMRLQKPDQDFTYNSRHNKPIKSVLNYIKGALGFMSITWRNNNYAQNLNPEYNNEKELYGVKEYLSSVASGQFIEERSNGYKDVIENLPKYLEEALKNSLFKKNKLKKHEVLLSQYATLCNCLSLENKYRDYSPAKKQTVLLEQLKERERFTIVLSDDPIITPDLIELQLKKGFFLMEDDVNKVTKDTTPSDEEIQDILVSAFPNYDTDQSGDF